MAEYFAGIRLPPDLEGECEAWRRQFKSPKTVAHITIVPPFEWNADPDSLLQLMQTIIGSTGPLAAISPQTTPLRVKRLAFLSSRILSAGKSARDFHWVHPCLLRINLVLSH